MDQKEQNLMKDVMITKFILKHEHTEESFQLARTAKAQLKKFYNLRKYNGNEELRSLGITKSLHEILNSNPYAFESDNESTEEVIHMRSCEKRE